MRRDISRRALFFWHSKMLLGHTLGLSSDIRKFRTKFHDD
jgi:hypothetical protein